MKFSFYTDDVTKLSCGLLGVLVFEEQIGEGTIFKAVDQRLDGLLARLVSDEQFKGKKGQTLSLHTHGRVASQRILLVGGGARKDLQPADLRGWTLAFEDSAGPRAPFLVLRGTAAVVGDLSHQLFKRTMESLSSPAGATIPLLLRGEYERSFAARVTPQQLLAIARNAGLGVGPLVPRCLGRRRVSDVGSTRQLFFLLFDLPAFAQFRHELSALAVVGQSGTGFDPAAMSPAMVVAMVQSTEDQWLPIAADAAVDCQTPVATTAP